MRHLGCVFFSILVLLLSSTATQAAACYTVREFEAEQGLRIHSELMVIALTCMKMPQASGIYQKYNAFTQKNQILLNSYERDLISFYRASGEAKPEKKFHSLRTGLANKISTHAISMSTASFCRQFAPRIDSALQMDQGKLRRWAQHVWPDTPTSEPLCRQ